MDQHTLIITALKLDLLFMLNREAIFIDDEFLVTLTDTLHLAPISSLSWIYD